MTTTFKNGLGKYDTGFYYYCFRLDGREFRGNTQTKDQVLARKVLVQNKEEAKQTLAREAKSLRQIWAVVLPASCSFKAKMICSSVYLLLLKGPSRGGGLTFPWSSFSGGRQ